MSVCTPTYSSQRAFLAADAALASKGRSFHWARRLLGSVHAERATRLYGICRYIDDLADEGDTPQQAHKALTDFSEELRSGISNDPFVLDAIALFGECQIDPTILQELVKGALSDLALVRIRDEDELIRYCYQVAGTVGLMMCGVLDVKNPDALAHAVDLGIAMQLTNICRDVSEDAQNNRRYLPSSTIGDLELKVLTNPERQANCKNDLEKIRLSIIKLLALAAKYYQSGEDGLSYLPRDARSAILVASRVYGGIGAELARREHDYWSQRARVSTFGKMRITGYAMATCVFRPSFWRLVRTHDSKLHHALVGLPGITANRKQAHDG
jgi:15-cis-phytoene synthase